METFGEANVVLKVPLDQLQRELDQAERMVNESNDRIARAQLDAARGAGAAGRETESGGMAAVNSLRSVFSWWKLVGGAIGAATLALRQLPAVAAAVSAVTVSAVTGLVLVFGRVADTALEARVAILDIVQVARNLDGSRQRALELAEALERIPIVGRMVRDMYLSFSRDAGMADEMTARWVATIEEGQVKVNWLGRAINGLINVSTPGILGRLLGLDTDFVRRIQEANDAIERMNALMQVQARSLAMGRETRLDAGMLRIQAERDAATAAVDGVQRVRLEEQFRHEDLVRQFDERRHLINQWQSQEVQRIREEGHSHARTRELLEENARVTLRMVQFVASEREAAEHAINDAAQARIELAEEEERIQRRIAEEQAERARAQRRAADAALGAGTDATRALLADQPFEAQRIELAHARHRAIMEAVQSGQQDQVRLIQDFYDARAELIDKNEREQMVRDRELAERRAQVLAQAEEDAQFRRLQTVEGLRSRILEERLRQAGEDVAAQEEAIRRQFQRMIDELEREGDQTAADLARTLRDLQIESLQLERHQSRGRSVRFEQVSLSRMALDVNRSSAEDKTARDQLAVLRGIERNTQPRERGPMVVS